MNFFLLLILLHFGLAFALPESKIFGGSEVDISKFPFTLSLRFYTIHVCGASAISSTWAVSAAHCLDANYPPSVVRLECLSGLVQYLKKKFSTD